MNQYILLSGKQKRLFIAVAIVAVLLSIIGGVALEQYYRLEVCNFESMDGESHGYYIYPGATLDSIVDVMRADYEIASEADWHWHKKQLAFATPKPGYYRFPPRVGDKHLIRRLQMGEQTSVRLTFNNEIRTREHLAGRLGKVLLLDSATIQSALEDDDFLARYGLNKETSRCLFLPDTYDVYWTYTVEDLFDRMQREYNKFWTAERKHKADSIGLTPVEVQIVASIVECETNKKSEYPFIASLYTNRVHKGMHLQACPSVKYAVGDFKLRRVLNRHLAVDHPYNTYKYPGLPPGPLRCANKSTIDDVLNQPHTDYLFMCANPDFSGTHIFSSSYGSHASAAVSYRHNLDIREAERHRLEQHIADSIAKAEKAANNF